MKCPLCKDKQLVQSSKSGDTRLTVSYICKCGFEITLPAKTAEEASVKLNHARAVMAYDYSAEIDQEVLA